MCDVDNVVIKTRLIYDLPCSLFGSLFALMIGMQHVQDNLAHRGRND